MTASAQELLEQEMTELGRERLKARVSKAGSSSAMTTTPGGRHMLRRTVESLSTAITEYLEGLDTGLPGRRPTAAGYLHLFDPDVAALIIAKAVLDRVAIGQKLNAAAVAIGGYLEDEAMLSYYRSTDNLGFEKIRLNKVTKNRRARARRLFKKSLGAKAELTWEPWPKRDKLLLGVTCIELCCRATGIAVIENRPRARGPKVDAWLVPDPQTLEWLEKANERSAIFYPFYLPCVEPPVDWTNPWGGGYSTNAVLRRPIIKTQSQEFLLSLHDYEMPAVYEAVNGLQRTAWQVNEDVRVIAHELWSRGSELAGLPHRDDYPMPPRIEDWENASEGDRLAHRRAARAAHEANTQARGQRVLVMKIIYMADKFADQPAFYFPHAADFRGRLYPVPYFLQPQGPDLARGLLRFAEGQPIGTPEAKRWLQIHGANCWGVKGSFEERQAWTEDNTDLISAVYMDPLDCLAWTDADKPFQFLAWCLEYGAYLECDDPSSFLSHLPIHADGSNNGLQIFSLLMRDPVCGRLTNCTPSEVPQDIYQAVADLVTKKVVAKQLSDRENEQFWANGWLKFCGGVLPRDAVKRPVMVLPYGGTLYSAHHYIMSWHDEKVRSGVESPWPIDKFQPAMWLAKLVWEAIRELIHAAPACMKYLQKLAALCSEHDVMMQWTSPSGFPIQQRYLRSNTREVRTVIGDSLRCMSLSEETDALHVAKTRNGISPNFVHSLDAAAVHQTVQRMLKKGVTSFAMIHDSYAVHAAHAELMATTLREVYADIFSAPVLEQFAWEVQQQLPPGTEMPEMPPLGTLDPRQVEASAYFFA